MRELSLPVRRGISHRFLAAVAYFTVIMVSRLPVHPSRRQPARALADLLQSLRGVRTLRPVARRELDVPGVGVVSRPVPRVGARGIGTSIRKTPVPAPPRLHSAGRDVRLGIFQIGNAGTCARIPWVDGWSVRRAARLRRLRQSRTLVGIALW